VGPKVGTKKSGKAEIGELFEKVKRKEGVNKAFHTRKLGGACSGPELKQRRGGKRFEERTQAGGEDSESIVFAKLSLLGDGEKRQKRLWMI